MAADVRGASHVGLCVPDLDAAITWYCDTFGFRVLAGPLVLTTDDPAHSEALQAVFGPEFRRARLAHLAIDGALGLELFEFEEPPTRRVEQSYFHSGLSHLCFVAPDLEETARAIERAGGRLRTRAYRERPDQPYAFLHFEDPFGNLLELHSHPYAEVCAGTSP